MHHIHVDGHAICDIECDALHRETSRSQGRLLTRFSHDPLGRRIGALTCMPALQGLHSAAMHGHLLEQPHLWQDALDAQFSAHAHAHAHGPANAPGASLPSLLKTWQFDKSGELLRSSHSLLGRTDHAYDASGRITGSRRTPLQHLPHPCRPPLTR
ncbi:hypothetical protein HMPREF9371_2358 [Neisseria shayeganii 871]|uniref:Uncharacterized protein n=1 Tax=Neisseria shayeganii 871 TaxID=1032488 RepID=G4CL67_9NEIS|nr:hypothetical protein HMPREF9371_2358 [Neisseria shayeganii 871]